MIFSYHKKSHNRKPASFLAKLVLVLVACWLGYHGLSYIFPENNINKVSIKKSNTSRQQTVIARIKPQTVIPMGRKKSTTLPLLAGTEQQIEGKNSSQNQRIAQEIKRILERSNQLIRQGKIIEARTLTNSFISQNPKDSAGTEILRQALKIGGKTIPGPDVYPHDQLCYRYRVKAGDTLSRLAKKCKIPYQFVCRVNQIQDPRKLRAGQTIKLFRGPINAKVIIHELAVYLYLQDIIFAKYDVGLGKNDSTPIGKWLVIDRVRRPVYCDPVTGQTYGPNDPNNPAGGFWIRLKGIEGKALGRTGFGLHGTDDPQSIKKFLSKGCIRIRNEDMERVFDMLLPGSSVIETLP